MRFKRWSRPSTDQRAPVTTSTNARRHQVGRADRVVALGVAGVLLVSVTRAFAGAGPLPKWRSCDDAVAIVDRRLPAPPDELKRGNRAGHILGRIWSSRPELHAALSADGRPNTDALAPWAASRFPTSRSSRLRHADDLAALVDSSVSLSTIRSLGSLLEWTGSHSHGSFYELEANRNAAFDLFVIARSSLLAEPDPATFVTGEEIVSWAWSLPVDDPAFEAAWNALDQLSIDET